MSKVTNERLLNSQTQNFGITDSIAAQNMPIVQQLVQTVPAFTEQLFRRNFTERTGPARQMINENDANNNNNNSNSMQRERTFYRLLNNRNTQNSTQSQVSNIQYNPVSSTVSNGNIQQFQQMPVQQMPVQQMPVQQMPVQQMSVQQMPVQQMPVQQMPVQPVAVQPVAVQPVAVQPVVGANTFNTSPVYPLSTPNVPPNVCDYTVGNVILPTANRLVRHTMFLYNNGVNTFPSFSRFILVIGNCNTSGNYQQFVDQDNLAEQYPNQVLPFSYYYQVEKSQLRFECFANWTWNLDMNVGQNLVTNQLQINIYDEIFIYPHEKLIQTRQLTRFNSLNTDLPTQYTSIFGYANQNDIFILLPDIETCYIGQKFNFYICRKVRNLYNPACLNCCEDESCTVPVAYQALLHQYSVNIYIFASDTLNRKNNYISDNNVFDGGLMIGSRVLHSDDKSIYYLKLDNETYFNDFQCDCSDERVFSLNPRNMFDHWKVEVSVVTYRNVKRFHVDTPLPPYTNNYQTPITTLPNVCNSVPEIGQGIFSRGVETA
jgi:hypothetical protein